MFTSIPKVLLLSLAALACPSFAAPIAADNSPATEDLSVTDSVAETTVDHLEATTLESGSSLKFLYRVSGRVKLGANFCHAEGVSAFFTASMNNGVLSITPFIRLPAEAFDRMCPAQSEPVYTQISTEVRGDRHKTASILVRNVEFFTANLPLELLLSQANTSVLVVQQGKVDRRSISENNDSFSLALKLRVSVPQDFCAAKPERIRVEQVFDQRELKVRVTRMPRGPTSEPLGDNELGCDNVYGGQANFAFHVSGQLSQIDNVMIENVQQVGAMVSLAEYLRPTAE
jgi:hypothetical protein